MAVECLWPSSTSWTRIAEPASNATHTSAQRYKQLFWFINASKGGVCVSKIAIFFWRHLVVRFKYIPVSSKHILSQCCVVIGSSDTPTCSWALNFIQKYLLLIVYSFLGYLTVQNSVCSEFDGMFLHSSAEGGKFLSAHLKHETFCDITTSLLSQPIGIQYASCASVTSKNLKPAAHIYA